MRVLVDTNALLSALLFPSGVTAKAVNLVLAKYRLVLCTYVLREAREVIGKKFSNRYASFEAFLNSCDFETAYTPMLEEGHSFRMRDHKDEPILVTAEQEDVDVILTGDLDFHALNITRPMIMNPTQFISEYGN